MDERAFLKLCKRTVVEYFNTHKDIAKTHDIQESEVFVVWFCKTLQNSKALLSTIMPDGMYYELTFNGDKKELYLDAYKKWENKLYTI